MTIDEMKALKNGDIFTYSRHDSHNNSLFVYRVETSEKRNIGWVVVVILLYKLDIINFKRRFFNKKYGFGLTDEELTISDKRGPEFLREEVERVFNGS